MKSTFLFPKTLDYVFFFNVVLALVIWYGATQIFTAALIHVLFIILAPITSLIVSIIAINKY
mgnify:CR=1 FL=1